jgi:hypothetical protein
MVVSGVVDFLKIQNPGSEWGDGGHLPDCHRSRKNETILKVALVVDFALPCLPNELMNEPLKVLLKDTLSLDAMHLKDCI